MRPTAIRVTLFVVTLFVCPVRATAQVRDQPRQPVRDNAPAAKGSASIVGTAVTDTEPARPLRRAIVTVNSTDWTIISKTTVTDDNGRFAVTDLPAGRYYVAASKRGWVRAAYGAKTPDQAGVPLTLADGQRASILLRLLRGAVITGVVVDDNGQSPMSTVSAVRYSQLGGERRLVPASTRSVTDERGQYRIYELAPGDYYILVSPGAVGPFRPGSELHLTSDVDVQEAMSAIQSAPGSPIADVKQRSVTVAPVFYPGVHSVAQATPVTVRAGEERGGVDFVVPYVASVHVEGTVSGLDGTPANNAMVTVVTTDRNTLSVGFGFESMRSARTDANGRFSFVEIRPGSYLISARTAAPAGWAQADLDVQGEDIRGVSLALQEAFTISGTIRFEGTANVPPFTNVRVNLAPEPGAVIVTSNTGGNATADGRFTIAGVTPGRYRLSAFLPGSRLTWTLKTSVLAGQEALDSFIDVGQGVSDASIVFTDQLSELSGHAALNSTVILFSTNQTQWYQQSRRVRMTRVATDGGYTVENVPPGEYFLADVDEIQPGQWFDPAYLQGLTTSATKITIAEGEKKMLDIRAGGGM